MILRLHHIKRFIHRFDHVLLLASLVITLALPLISDIVQFQIANLKILNLVTIVASLSVVFTTDAKRLKLFLWYGNALAILTVVDLVFPVGVMVENILTYAQVLFYFILTGVLLKFILKLKRVSGEMIINAISGYLLLGICWAIVVKLWGIWHPEAYNFNLQNNLLTEETYYAFITMTTLGYGDYLPVTASSKALAVFMSITGAFYTTLVMGIIVGKYIAQETQK